MLAASAGALTLGFTAQAPAQTQEHGIGLSKGCVARCVNQALDCQMSVRGNSDDCGHVQRIDQAFEVVHAASGDVRVPPSGNLPIVSIVGNALCTAGPSLPCYVGPAGSTAMTPLGPLPGNTTGSVTDGRIIFQASAAQAYIIQPGDPDRMFDTFHVLHADTNVPPPVNPPPCNSTGDPAPHENTINGLVDILHPSITSTKAANPTGPFCTSEGAQAITYTYNVTRGGDIDLTNVNVTDNHCGPVNRLSDNPGDNDNILEVGETWRFACGPTIISQTTTNTATVTADPVTAGDEEPPCITMNQTSVTVTFYPTPCIEVAGATVCSGTTTAQMCAIVTGGTPPYSVRWYAQSAPGVTLFSCAVLNNSGDQCCAPSLPAGAPGQPITYCAEVTDSHGCKNTDCGNLVTNPNRMVTVEDQSTCEGGEPPPLCAVIAGGRCPYSVDWVEASAPGVVLHHCDINCPPGDGDSSICCFTPPHPGTFIAKVTDDNGCHGEDSGTLSIHPGPQCNIEDPDRIICDGTTTMFVARPHGGTAPYTVVWRDPSNTVIQTCSNVPELGTCTTPAVSAPGQYCATITDAAGCIGGPCCGNLTVVPNPSVFIAPNRICAGVNSGQLCAQVSGGTPPYSVQFFQNNQPVGAPCVVTTNPGNCCRNLAPGTYTAVAIDSHGCQGSGVGSLSVNPNPIVNVTGESVCSDSPTAQICATVSGGDAPYTIHWYLQGAPNITLASCTVNSDGDQCCVELPPGPPGSPLTYCAEAIDRKGCIGTGCGSLESTPGRIVNVNDRQVCEGQPLPPLCAVVSGGRPPYIVRWVSAAQPNIVLFTCRILENGGQCCFTPELPGTYIAKVEDANHCFQQDDGTITVNPLPTCSVDKDSDHVCQGEFTSFVARPHGGTAPYTITWSGPAGFTRVCTGLLENDPCSTGPVNIGGMYCVTVTDAKGCVNPDSCCSKLFVSQRPACEVEPCTVEMCADDEPITITAHGLGGSGGPYTFEWQHPIGVFFSNGPSIQAPEPGIYCARVTDGAGCLGSDLCCAIVLDGTITCSIQPPQEPPLCGSTGNTLHAIVSGLKPPFFYHWELDAPGCGWAITGGQTSDTVIYTTGCVNTRGDFTLTVMDLHGCTSTCTINITCDCPPNDKFGCPSPFWSAPEHLGDWVSPYCPGVGYNGCLKSTKFTKVFECGNSTAAMTAFHGKTLLQVLQQSGGGCKALGREAVAALLNAAAYGNNFDSTFNSPQVVINKFNKVMKKNGGYPTAGQMANLRYQLLALNSQGCPNDKAGNGGAPVASHSPDLNNDGKVNQGDLDVLLSQWGRPGTADLNGDGIVGPADLAILLNWWGW